jgi:hypothetical protein
MKQVLEIIISIFFFTHVFDNIYCNDDKIS